MCPSDGFTMTNLASILLPILMVIGFTFHTRTHRVSRTDFVLVGLSLIAIAANLT